MWFPMFSPASAQRGLRMSPGSALLGHPLVRWQAGPGPRRHPADVRDVAAVRLLGLMISHRETYQPTSIIELNEMG